MLCNSSLIANLSSFKDFVFFSFYGWKLVKTKKVVLIEGFNYLRCLLQFGFYLRVLCDFTFFSSVLLFDVPLRSGSVQFI